MKNFMNNILHFFEPLPPIQPGIYTAQNLPQNLAIQKAFLRVEPDGTGTLILNAAMVLHLNQVAVDMAYGLIQGFPDKETINRIVQKYRVSRTIAEKDFKEFLEKLTTFTLRTDLDPEEFFEIAREIPYETSHLTAPYRIDCALTYRLSQNSNVTYTPDQRVKKELSTAEWKSIINKIWQAGIPHIIFTGGEPTLREDLVELIQFTEEIGMVCGLISDGLKLADENYLNQIIQAGLDHILITLDTNNELSWNAIQLVASKDIFTAIHLTLDAKDRQYLRELIQRLAESQINGVSLSIRDPLDVETLAAARDLCAMKGLRLIWDLPVPYSRFNPITLDMVNDQVVDGAGKAWVYVEPDADVLPAQGVNVILGNLLADDWKMIWLNCQNYVQQATSITN